MKCPHCGKELKNDAKFCRYCGKEIAGNADNPTETEEISSDPDKEEKSPKEEREPMSGESDGEAEHSEKSETENTRTETRKSGRKRKWILIGIALIAAAACAVAAVIAWQSRPEEELRLVNGETGEYILYNVDKNFTLEITGKEENLKTCKVMNLEEGEVRTSSEISDDTLTISPPEGGYEPGEAYTISIREGSRFVDERLKDARTLTFIIYKDKRAEIVYAKNVKQAQNDEIETDGERLISKKEYKQGDIVVTEGGEDQTAGAYKITGAQKSGDRWILSWEEPKLDEVYESIDISQTVVSDGKYLEVEKDVVLEAARDMGILEAFTDEAEALTMKDISCKVTNKGKDELGVTIAIHDPKHKNRELDLNFGIKYVNHTDLTLHRQFIDTQMEFTSGIEVSMKGSTKDATKKKIESAISSFEEEEEGSLGESNKSDKTFLDIFTVRVPVVGTIAVYTQMGLNYEMTASGEIFLNLESGIKIKQGILVSKGAVKKVYASAKPKLTGELMAQGRLYEFLGIGGEIGVELLPGTGIGFNLTPGVYGDQRGYFVIENILKPLDGKGYYDLEAGVKVDGDVAVNLNYIAGKYRYNKTILSLKKPFVKYANTKKVKSVNLRDSYSLTDGKVEIGTLKAVYEDVITKKESGKTLKKYRFYIDGEKVNVKKGVIAGGISEGEHTFSVVWEHDGQERKFEKKVRVTEYYPFEVYTADSFHKQTGSIENYEATTRENPGYMDVDVKIPRVSEDTKNSEQINQKIDAFLSTMGYDSDLRAAKENDYETMEENYTNYLHVEYQVTHSSDTTALIVTYGTAPSFPTSIDTYSLAVYYDNLTGEVLSGEEYAERNGYTVNDVFAAYSIGEPIYDDLINNRDYWEVFYFDDSGDIQFITGKYV